MKDHRILLNGTRLNFTCENHLLKTDINRGILGSVTASPLYDDGNFSLRLEYVVDTSNNKKMWFMWYDAKGMPTIPMSGVIEESDIAEVIRNISQIKF